MRTDKARRCALSGKYFVIKEITQLHNSMNLKKSKFNYSIIDQEGNLIIYNFLRGIPSLTKVAKKDIDKFSQLVLKNTGISNASSNGYTKAISSLIESGLLVDEKTDENVLLDAKCYNAIYDNKLQLIILPTGQCNFKCVYCLESEQSFARNAMNLDSQNAILQFLQKQISDYNGLQVAWFGGEPMLEPETIKYLSENFIRICKSRFIPYSAHITTNGFNLNADMFDMLYKLKVYTYMITVDGFKNQHDKQRITHSGKGTYDRILNNLLRIKNSKQYKFARIIIRVNITKNNIDSIDDFINYMHTLFSDDHRFEFLFVPAEDFSKNKCSENNIFVNSNDLFSHLKENKLYMEDMNPWINDFSVIEPSRGCDASLKNNYVIAPDLKIYKCCAHYDMLDNNIGHINLNGDLLVDEARHSKWYLINNYIKKPFGDCENCFYLPACNNCTKGCPASYIKQGMKEFSCIIKNDKMLAYIDNTILRAAQKFPCTSIIL